MALNIMSLLTSVNAGTPAVNYFIENVGGTNNPAPCIKGGLLGPAPGFSDTAVRVGNPVDGMVLTGGGGTYLPLLRGINGGSADTTGGESLVIGASEASFQNIVLQDNATRVNSDLTLGAAATVGSGDLIFANGGTGSSISGYYSVNTAVAATGAQANPAGITQGTYLVVYVPTGGAQGQQPSGVFYWSGVAWAGNAVGANFTGPTPDIAILPTAGNATLTVGGAAASVPGTLFWRKLLN
jgi:hypothetical protein